MRSNSGSKRRFRQPHKAIDLLTDLGYLNLCPAFRHPFKMARYSERFMRAIFPRRGPWVAAVCASVACAMGNSCCTGMRKRPCS